MSINATENGQRLALAFFRRVERTKTASIVLLPFRNPNCSGPRSPWISDKVDTVSHIRIVMSLSKFEGIVMGRYWPGDRESPP